MNDYQLLQDIGRSKTAMVYKVWSQAVIKLLHEICSHRRPKGAKSSESLQRLSDQPFGPRAPQGRKRKTIEFFALKCVDKSQKSKIMHEVHASLDLALHGAQHGAQRTSLQLSFPL